MQASDTIFSKLGTLREDLDQVQVPPERRPVFDALVKAVHAEKAADAALKIADAAVAEAVKLQAEAARLVPRSSFMDEWRAMVGAKPR